VWLSDNPVLRSGMANDHLNVKADSKGRDFAVTKTRCDRIDRDLDARTAYYGYGTGRGTGQATPIAR
jgi:hypothetical protein